MPPPNPQRQRDSLRRLDELCADAARCFAVQYACQSLYQDEAQGSPRITAVAARNLQSGDAYSFAIATEVELLRLTPVQVLSRFDELERRMLEGFYEFLRLNRTMNFVHWHMRDQTYGFAALEHRARLLGVEPLTLPEAQRIDLAKLFKDIYGHGYAGDRPREQLASRNGLPVQGFLDGVEERDRFERGDYRAVMNSTLVKARLYCDLLSLAHDRQLSTRANWWTMNVGRVREAAELFRHNPVSALAGLAGGAFMVFLKVLDYFGY